jgi:hypothetical protein
VRFGTRIVSAPQHRTPAAWPGHRRREEDLGSPWYRTPAADSNALDLAPRGGDGNGGATATPRSVRDRTPGTALPRWGRDGRPVHARTATRAHMEPPCRPSAGHAARAPAHRRPPAPTPPAASRPPGTARALAIGVAWSMVGKGGTPATPPSAPAWRRPAAPATPSARTLPDRLIPHAACATSSRHQDRLVYGREGRGADHAALRACTAPAAHACHAVLPHAAGRPIPHAACRQPPDPACHQLPMPGSGVVSLRWEGCLPSPLSPSGARGRDQRRQRKELLASDVD